jgi:hypothetical protein
MTEVNDLNKAEKILKNCEDYTFWESHGQFFWGGFSRHPILRFSDRTKSYQCSLLFEASYRSSKAGLSFKTTSCISQKLLSPPRQRASAHGCCDNMDTEGNIPGDTITSRQSPKLVPSDFHLFGPLKRPLEESLEPTMKLNFLCYDGWKPSTQSF